MNTIEVAKRLKTIADIGLLYHTTEYDKERYQEIKELSFQLLNQSLGIPLLTLSDFYAPVREYPTVKVDVRCLLLNAHQEILMVQEQSDQRWSLPGGWAEPGFSPSEAIIKEVKEECGIIATCKQLLAIYDIRCHPHPTSPYAIYKIILLCDAKDYTLNKGFDIVNVGFFPIGNLPPLSENRILKTQIEILFDRVQKGEISALFD